MKSELERRKSQGFIDYLSLAITTVGVGYLPLAPGTWGSIVGVVIYLFAAATEPVIVSRMLNGGLRLGSIAAIMVAANAVLFFLLCLAGIWASGRSTSIFGNSDPSQAVIDEVMGQLMVFVFVPFGISWPFILAGFLLFRLFDIWKPYPIRNLEILPGGLGICADDLVAGVYAGICLAVIYAVNLYL